VAARQLRFGAAARAALLAGIDAVADTVCVSLGPKGRYVAIERSGDVVVTNDGVAIARELELAEPFSNQGARLIRHVASVTEEVAGDGTTTATVLAQALVRAGIRSVAAGADAVAVRRGIERAVAQAVAHLGERQAIGIAGIPALARVAAVAARDDELGKVVADAFEAVGVDGVVSVQRGETGGAELELAEGMRFHQGYLSPHMATDPERAEAVLEDAYVLIADQELTDADQLVGILEQVAGRPLLVVADKVTGSALGLLVRNALEGRARCVAVKARHVGSHRRGHLEELALFTGGESIAESVGMRVEQAQLGQLGRAERVVVTASATTISGGAGDRRAIAARVGWLRRELEQAGDTGERAQLRERLGELADMTATISAGARTEPELAERISRADDAVRAARAALREGIVPGGGVALLEAADAIDTSGLGADAAAGAEIVRRALSEPLRRIAENAGIDGSVAVARTRALPEGDGLDVRSGEYVDMIDAGISDPALVARVALQSAASVAKLILTTEVIGVEPGGGAAAADEPGFVAPKRLAHGPAARAALHAGVEAAARAVGVTLGPAGRSVVHAGGFTRDGVTVARAIEVGDPFEAVGARLVRDVAGATEDDAGDGTTTATVLACAMVAAGRRNAVAGADPNALRRGIEHAVEQAVAHLRDVQSAAVGAGLAQVATVASGDEALGAVVAEAYERAGRDGVVSVAEGHTTGLRLELAPGMRWDKGALTNTKRGELILEQPHVLCADRRIRSAEELVPVLELVVESKRPLLLVVLGLDAEASRMLVANTLRGRITAVAVTAPDFLERRRRNLEDIAILTGGEPIAEELGRGLEHVRLDQVGSARRAIVTRETTTIVDGGGERAAIEARIDELRRELDRDGQVPFLRERLRGRLARLAAGVATIEVGAATESEASERLQRAQDAIRAAAAALDEGVVPGGGVALLRARDAVDPTGLHADEATGADIVRRALEEPLRRIAENAGLEPAPVIERVRGLAPREGLDAATGEYRDLVAAGIVDPTRVVRSALENAASIAKTLLLAESVAVPARR
jgi:chaperonin GroEL